MTVMGLNPGYLLKTFLIDPYSILEAEEQIIPNQLLNCSDGERAERQGVDDVGDLCRSPGVTLSAKKIFFLHTKVI